MKDKKLLVQTLRNLYETKLEECFAIYNKELVNNGRMTISSLKKILSEYNDLEDKSDVSLAVLYQPLCKAFDIPSVDTFFTKQEQYEAAMTMTKRMNTKLPLRFKILSKLTDGDNYLVCLSIQEIQAIKEAGLIHWEETMQRESVITNIGGDRFVSHIKYSDKRAREIGKLMAAGEFFPNSLRWHITCSDENQYEVTDTEIILHDGFITELDGQHRDKGSEYALEQSPDVVMKLPVILTIGSVSMAQNIIYQDEKREPINKQVVASYKNSSANSIMKMVVNGNIDDVYKFCDTDQGISAGSGFILKSDFAESINKYYCMNDQLSRKQEMQISEWLTEFLVELADIFHDEFAGFRNEKKVSLIANSKTFYLYVYISSMIKGRDNWRQVLKDVISRIDFSRTNKELTNIKYMSNLFEGENSRDKSEQTETDV